MLCFRTLSEFDRVMRKLAEVSDKGGSAVLGSPPADPTVQFTEDTRLPYPPPSRLPVAIWTCPAFVPPQVLV